MHAGERMQIHRNGDEINYFSRSAKDSGQMYNYTLFDTCIKEQVKEDPCILDCEIVAWNKREYTPPLAPPPLHTHTHTPPHPNPYYKSWAIDTLNNEHNVLKTVYILIHLARNEGVGV